MHDKRMCARKHPRSGLLCLVEANKDCRNEEQADTSASNDDAPLVCLANDDAPLARSVRLSARGFLRSIRISHLYYSTCQKERSPGGKVELAVP